VSHFSGFTANQQGHGAVGRHDFAASTLDSHVESSSLLDRRPTWALGLCGAFTLTQNPQLAAPSPSGIGKRIGWLVSVSNALSTCIGCSLWNSMTATCMGNLGFMRPLTNPRHRRHRSLSRAQKRITLGAFYLPVYRCNAASRLDGPKIRS
jgi:hypothetical protein